MNSEEDKEKKEYEILKDLNNKLKDFNKDKEDKDEER